MRTQQSAILATLLTTCLASLQTFAQESANPRAPTEVKALDVSASAKSSLSVGQKYFVSATSLNFRRDTSMKETSIAGKLIANDQVEVLNLLDGKSTLVEVKVVASGMLAPGSIGYVSAQHLSKQGATLSNAPSKYIVIQNIATERARVYERCTQSPDCPHRMVFETEIVVGRTEGDSKDEDRYLTWLGRFKLLQWVKFHEDGAGHYPSWYHPKYPPVPYNPSDAKIWFSKKLMPDKDGTARGGFGWYTAFVGPRANEQWMHGTYGWGIEGNKYIKYTRNFWVNLFANPRSSGCTRVENKGIAYLRHILPAGTEILRVYAKEGYRDRKRQAYANQKNPLVWEWILTTEGVQSNGPDSDKASVLARNVPSDQILEWGSYKIDQHPDALGINEQEEARTGKSGNTYSIREQDFQGTYLVDEGRFVNYQHPQVLPKGGYDDAELPEYLRASGPFYSIPKVEKIDPTNNNP